MFGLTEASTRRRAVGVGRPITASAGSILAGESFMLRASRPDLDGGARLRRTHLEHPRRVLALTEASTRCRRSCSGGHLFLRGSRCTARGLPVSATARSKAVLIRRLCLCQFRAFVHDPG